MKKIIDRRRRRQLAWSFVLAFLVLAALNFSLISTDDSGGYGDGIFFLLAWPLNLPLLLMGIMYVLYKWPNRAALLIMLIINLAIDYRVLTYDPADDRSYLLTLFWPAMLFPPAICFICFRINNSTKDWDDMSDEELLNHL